MKRILSFLLALSLIAGLMAGITLTASAEDVTLVDKIDITAPEFADGDTLSVDNVVASEGVVIESASWQKYTGDDCWDVIDGGVFSSQDVYRLYVSLLPAEGYSVGDDSEGECPPVSFNGTPADYCGYWGYHDEENDVIVVEGVYAEIIVIGSDVEIISEVTVDIPEAEVGAPMAAISVPEDANYQISYFSWSDDNGNYYSSSEPELLGQLEDNNRYSLSVGLTAAAGAWFAEEVTVNSSISPDDTWSYNCQTNASWSYSFIPTVTDIAISGLPVNEGDVVSKNSLQVPDGANYTVTIAEMLRNGENVDSFTYGEGSFYLNLEIRPTGDYTFDLYADEITLNGTPLYGFGWDIWWAEVYPDVAFVQMYKENLPENGYANWVQLYNLPSEIVPGNEIATPELWGSESIVITDSQWLDAEFAPVSGAFEDGKAYYLAVTMEAAEGWGFDYNIWVEHFDEYGNWLYDENFEVNEDGTVTAYIRYSLIPTIDFVELEVEEPVLGSAPGKVTVLSGDCTIEYEWYDLNTETLATVFEYGHKYDLYISVYAAEGYEFSEYFTININGEWVEGNVDGTSAFAYMTYSFMPTIDQVDITIPEPEIGGTPTTPTLDASQGTITNTSWYDADLYEDFTKFEDNHKYSASLWIEPVEGHEYTEDTIVTVNGKEISNYYIMDGILYVTAQFSFKTVIDTIEIEVDEPEVGEELPVPTIPEDADYVIDYYEWIDLHTWNIATEVEDGHKYQLNLNLIPKDGCEFSEEAVILYNGEESDEYSAWSSWCSISATYSFMDIIDRVDITVPELTLGGTLDLDDIKVTTDGCVINYAELYGWRTDYAETGKFVKDKYSIVFDLIAEEGYEFAEEVVVYINGVEADYYWAWNSEARAEVYYDFRDEITKVELSALLESIKVGDYSDYVELTTPDGANYTVNTQWLINKGAYELDTFEGIFEDKNVYMLAVEIIPNAGYKLADDVVLTVGGKEYAGQYFSNEDYIVLYKQYVLGLEIIDTIELNVTKPENGKAPTEITVPEDALYDILSFSWGYAEDLDLENSMGMDEDDVFEYGYYYWISGAVQAKEGYVFADDVVIKINGEVVEMEKEWLDMMGVMTPMGDVAFFINNLGLLMDPNENPKTGDSSTILLSALAVLAVTGMAVTVVSKKRFF